MLLSDVHHEQMGVLSKLSVCPIISVILRRDSVLMMYLCSEGNSFHSGMLSLDRHPIILRCLCHSGVQTVTSTKIQHQRLKKNRNSEMH